MEAGPRKQPDFDSQPCEMLPASRTITNLSILRRQLLTWYDTNRRALPWRRSTDPYRIWLSEIMLQQTRVAAVLEHYRTFLVRFRNVDELAAAPLASVLAAWSGLGYYRRARSLHRAARQIVARHQSRFPRTLPELRALPGVGRYTGAALASIAFGLPVAAVDGNVERVLSRLLAHPAHPGEPASSSPDNLRRADYWALAEALLARRRPGDWNQAMMELGATVCLPRQPQCQSCPLKRWCPSKLDADRATSGITAKPSRMPRQKCQQAYMLAQRRSSVYLVRRDRQAKLMAGMWELPRLRPQQPRGQRVPALCPGKPGAGVAENSMPAPTRTQEPLFKLKHSITMTDYEVAIYGGKPAITRDSAGEADAGVASTRHRVDFGSNVGSGNWPRGDDRPVHGRWVRFTRLAELPLTGLTRKVLRRAGLI